MENFNDRLKDARTVFFGNVNNVIFGDYHAHGPVKNSMAKGDDESGKQKKRVPTFDEMMHVFKKMNQEGYWSSRRSWGVGFQLWQIWGWKGSVADFVKLVVNSGEMDKFDYECNENAVYKMINKGHLSLHLENWEDDGVLEPYCILGTQINGELEKMFPTEELEDEEDLD